MITLNRVIISGRLTQDPEIREVGQAKKRKLAKFGIAYTKVFAAQSGQRKEAMFVDIQVWEKQALYIEKFLHKGDPCIVEGSLVCEQWRTKLGELKSKIAIRAERVQKLYLSKKNDEEGDGQNSEYEEDTPPQKSEHRYKPEDALDPRHDYPDSVEPVDDNVVPF